MKSNYKRLRDYIEVVEERNRDLSVTLSQGICNLKYFQNPRQVAENSAADKIVRKGWFAYNRATTRNGDKISIAYRDGEDCTVSASYLTFKIKDENLLNPYYLMMWFKRPEFDRYARFKSHGSAHEYFEWDEMCEVMLPVPPIEEQRKIVAEYQAVERRIENNRRLIATLEDAAQTIYRKMFVDDIDPNNLPQGWRMGKLGDIVSYVNIKVNAYDAECYISTENMQKNFGGVVFAEDIDEEIKGTRFKKGDVLLSNIRPYFKKLWHSDRNGCWSNDVLCFRPITEKAKNLPYYIMSNNQFFDYVMAGAKGVKMPRGDKQWIMNYVIPIPDDTILKLFSDRINLIKTYRSFLDSEIISLENLKNLFLTKLSKL